MEETIERYRNHVKDIQPENSSSVEDAQWQHLKDETASMAKKIELLELAKRKFLGEGLGSSTIEELLQIEQQLERSVSIIRARKEKLLACQNAMLTGKCLCQTKEKKEEQRANLQTAKHGESSDVETELFIGLPEKRMRQDRPK